MAVRRSARARAPAGMLLIAVLAVGLVLAAPDGIAPPEAFADDQFDPVSGRPADSPITRGTTPHPCSFAPSNAADCSATWTHRNYWNVETVSCDPAFNCDSESRPEVSQCRSSQACPHGPHDSTTCEAVAGGQASCRTWTGHQNVNMRWEARTPRFHLHCPGDATTVVDDLADCAPPDCVPGPGQHAHGATCEANHPAVPSCALGVPDTDTRAYTAHNGAGDNISVSVPGCDSTGTPDCTPQAGEHAHGSACEANHPPAPSCVSGLVNTQTRAYTTHNGAGQNTQVSVAGCDEPDPDPVNCPQGQVPDGSGGCRDPILACPDGWTPSGSTCVPPDGWIPPKVADPDLPVPAGLRSECVADAGGERRVRYSWDPVPGWRYQLVGSLRVPTIIVGGSVALPNGDVVWLPNPVGWETRISGQVVYVGGEADTLMPYAAGTLRRWDVGVRVVAADGTFGEASSPRVAGYCVPAPENVAAVCAWAGSRLAVGLAYDGYEFSTGYEVEGTHEFSYGVIRAQYRPSMYLLGLGHRVASPSPLSSPQPGEGEAVSVRTRLNVLDMRSELSAAASAVCPHAVERVFAQCAFGRLRARWEPIPAAATVIVKNQTRRSGGGWRTLSTAEYPAAAGSSSLDVAAPAPDPRGQRIVVQVTDDNNRYFPAVRWDGHLRYYNGRSAVFPHSPAAAEATVECEDAVTGLAVECPAPHGIVTVSWDPYPAGQVVRYEVDEGSAARYTYLGRTVFRHGKLDSYEGTATSFARASPVGDVYEWRVRAVLDDGAGGETATPWTPLFEKECPPAPPEAPQIVCVAATATRYYDLTSTGLGLVPYSVPSWGLDGAWAADSRARSYEHQNGAGGAPASVSGVTTSGSDSTARIADVAAPTDADVVGGRLRLRALGDSGTVSEWSDWADYQCLPADFAVECPAPHGTVAVSWSPLPGTVARYEAEEDGGTLAPYSGTATSFDRASPTGDLYRWRIRAVLNDGAGGEIDGPWSQWAERECPPARPAGLTAACADTTVYGPPQTFHIPGVGDITLPGTQNPGWDIEGAWTADARALRYESQRDEAPEAPAMSVSGTTLRTDWATTDNSAGRIRIRALGNNGVVSEWSDWADYECLPIPTGLDVDCTAGTLLAATWDNDPNATAYEAEEDGATLPAYSGAANTFTRTAVTGEAYRWRVRAEIGGIWTQWTDWAEAVCGQPPTGLRVACVAGGALSPAVLSAAWDPISWATGYEAEEDGADLTAYAGAAVTFNRYTAAVNTEYRWRVRAVGTGSARSPWTGWVSDTCPPAAPLAFDVQCGPAPLSRTLTVDWAAPAGARDYQVEASASSAAFTAYYGTATSLGRLGTWGTTYELRVRAWSVAGGWGNWTSYDAATCPPAPHVRAAFQVQILDWGAHAARWGRSVWNDPGRHPVIGSATRHSAEWTAPSGSTAISPGLADPPAPVVVEPSSLFSADVLNIPTPTITAANCSAERLGGPSGGKATSATLAISYSVPDPLNTPQADTVTVPNLMSGYTYRVWARVVHAGSTTGPITEWLVICEASDCGASVYEHWTEYLFDVYQPAHEDKGSALHWNQREHPGKTVGDLPAAALGGRSATDVDPTCCAEAADSNNVGVGLAGCKWRCGEMQRYSVWFPRQQCGHLK